MKNIYIVYRTMFTPNGEMNTIGGIENYILNLTDIFAAQGWEVHIVQPACNSFEKKDKNFIIHGVETRFLRGNLKKLALSNWIKKNVDQSSSIVIFGTDSYAVKISGYKTIGIQHGVSWDKPRKNMNPIFQFFSSFSNQCKYLSYTKNTSTIVCVDHNFVNWYRTWFNTESKLIKVIYNFYKTKISDKEFNTKWENSDSNLKIIISRRFIEYRGIKVIAPIIKKILSEYEKIEVCFAGEGPLKYYLESMFDNESRVTITQYGPEESFEIHKQHHIAIIPTLGSEGTSLSMIEAMAAGCMVISTNVGGLSNLIINGYNGLLTMPDKNELEQALHTSLSDHAYARNLAGIGLRSIENSCSKETWGSDWIKLIKRL